MKIETRILFFFANQKDLEAERQAVALLDDWLSDGWVAVAELFHNDTVYIRLERKLDEPVEQKSELIFTRIARSLVQFLNKNQKVSTLVISAEALRALESELREGGDTNGVLTRVLGLEVICQPDLIGSLWWLE